MKSSGSLSVTTDFWSGRSIAITCMGLARAFVEEMVAQGKIVISDIDIQGAEQLRRTMPDGVFIFLMPPSLEELRREDYAPGDGFS